MGPEVFGFPGEKNLSISKMSKIEPKESGQRVTLIPTFQGAVGKDYPFWKVRVTHYLKQQGLLHCLERIPPMEDYADTPDGATEEEKTERHEKYQRRTKEDDEVVNIFWTSLDNNAMAHVLECVYAKEILDRLDTVYLRQGQLALFSIRRKLYNLRTAGCKTLMELFLTHERLIQELERAGEVISAGEKLNTLLVAIPDRHQSILDALSVMRRGDLATMSISDVRSLFLDAEEKKEEQHELEPSNVAMAATNRGRKKKKETRTCFECGKVGHTKRNCFRLREREDVLRKRRGSERERFPAERANIALLSVSEREYVPTEHKRSKLSPDKRASEMETFPAEFKREKFKMERGMTAGSELERIQTDRKPKVRFIVDSGASDHMICDDAIMKDCRAVEPVTVSTAKDGQVMVGRKKGNVKLKSVVCKPGKIKKFELYDVLFIPNLQYNLLSVSKMVSAGKRVTFDNHEVVISDHSSGEVIVSGKKVGGLFVLDMVVDENENVAYIGEVDSPIDLWHKRLGHLGLRNMEKLVSQRMVDGLNIERLSHIQRKHNVCPSCVIGKHTRKPFRSNCVRSTRPLEVIHSDVCGPMSEGTYDGYRYFVVFIDDFTHFVVVYLMHHKSEVLSKFKEYEGMATAHFNSRISRFVSDNGGEYYGHKFQKFCVSKGIQMIPTCPYTPQQNGVSERMNRTLLDKTRAMLNENNVPKKLWGEAVYVAAYLTNRSPTQKLGSKTPFEMWFDTRPRIDGLRIFGCMAYGQIPKERRKKLDDKSKRLTFVGYATNGYRLWDDESRKIIISRDVIFDESQSIFRLPQDSGSKMECQYQKVEVSPRIIESSDDTDISSEGESDDSRSVESKDDFKFEKSDGSPTPSVRRSKRIQDKQKQVEEKMENVQGAFSAVSFIEDIPQTIPLLKAREDWSKWKAAIQEEMEALEANNTWTLVRSIPTGFRPINSMWIFSVKGTETSKRYKARLVAKGCSQRYGFDYNETFAPVAKMVTIRTILSIAVVRKMLVHQMDVKTAFLNGNLEEEVYMKLPCDEDGKSPICRLNRSLYGLKQAGRSWNQCFDNFMMKIGFHKLSSDSCAYVCKEHALYLVLYVDDILIVGEDITKVNWIKEKLTKRFRIKDMGELKTYLGLEIERNFEKKEMIISQKSYIEKTLCRFGMQDCKPVATPMDTNFKWDVCDSIRTEKPYKALLGCLQYLASMSRPDISAAVSILSRFQSCADESHWNGLKRILRYLQGSKDLCLVYCCHDEASALEGYADADYGNNYTDRRSNSGNLFLVYGNLVSWSTKRQPTVSLSSTEAELISLCNGTKEGIWISNLLREVGIESCPFTIYEDNIPCIRIAEEPREHQRTKHIDIKYMFIREVIQSKKMRIQYIRSEDQLADILTKPTPRTTFERMTTKLQLRNLEEVLKDQTH